MDTTPAESEVVLRRDLLRSTRLFHNAPTEVLQALADSCETVTLEESEVLFDLGDQGDALYIVEHGNLEVYLGDALLDQAGTGDCLGEMALLNEHRKRAASVRAATSARLLRLDRRAFRNVLDCNSELAWGIIQELADKIKSSIRVRVEQHRFAMQLEEAFARSVSRTVMDEILASKDAQELLNGNKKKAIVLFADIRSFTRISELLPPRQLIHLLNEYLSAAVDLVLDAGGTLDKFMGDGLMAYFGIPITGGDDSVVAVKCALAMMERVDELNRRGEYMPSCPLKVGVGLATGQVVAGCVGSKRRMDYTAIGDPVNLAACIEDLTKIYDIGILLCGETAQEISDQVELHLVDRVRVKGRETATDLYTVPLAGSDSRGLASAYGAALEAYLGGHFAAAARQFEAAAQRFHNNGPSRLLAQRCWNLASCPPADWDGVYTLEIEVK